VVFALSVLVALVAGVAQAYPFMESPTGNTNYGKVRLGHSVTKSITLVNHSSDSETITLKSTACEDSNWPHGPSTAFDCTHDLGGVVLAPGESTRVNVTFKLPSRGFFQADMAYTASDSAGNEFSGYATFPYGRGCVKKHQHLRC
jgi:hypothetical protein